MIVQEAGIAVGWPLGLGHDTTGWPLGLRLRLTQEDLQWPREPPLDDSPSFSTNSSSLDTSTESARSFFQDKSISLGTLIGLPINQYPAANTSNAQAQRRNRRSSGMLRVFPTSKSSGSRCGSEHHHHHWRSGSKSRSSTRHSSHGSNRPQCKSAASAGWALLSALSCARVPSAVDAGNRPSKSSSSQSSSSSKSSSRGGSELSTTNPPEIPTLGKSAAAAAAAPFTGRIPTLAGKLYDNITFEEEATDHDESHSSEWNPLFASSSVADDVDEEEHDEDPDALTEPLEHWRQSLMRSHSSHSNSSQASDWSSASESFDKRKSKSSSSSSTADHHHMSQFGKNSAMHLLLSRMVCCRSTPIVR